MATYVLGTHTSHDGSACLLKDGLVAVAIEKERITGIKHDGGNDNAAVHYCLKAEGIKLRDVALVVQNANFDMFERKGPLNRGFVRAVESAGRVVTISHHLAHMFSAAAAAPFAETAALVIDGCGNCYADCIDKEGAVIPERPPTRELEQLYFEKDSYYEFREGEWHAIYKDFSPHAPLQPYPMFPVSTMHSIGGAYGGVSQYVFRGMEDPGKLMGLAPYGKPNAVKGEMFRLEDGRVFLNYDWMTRFDRPAIDHEDFKTNFQYYADIAWWTQREVERALLYLIDDRYERFRCDNLVYSGGVALNAVANHLIKTRRKFKNIFIQPAAGDNGLALGCAYYGWLQVLKGRPRKHNGSSHFGRRYTKSEIETSLGRNATRLRYREEPDVVEVAATLLTEGKVIGWFQDGSEFGPRALGHRSILAIPDREELKDFINGKIKFREDFRPFAPSVLREDASTYFELDYDSPYMILVAPTREEWRSRMPAVVHRDGSARVQTVHREITPRYHSLLQAIKRKTGMSVLLNTSLNRRGMPIVETPVGAIEFFLDVALDALVIGDWVVTKNEEVAREAPLNLDDLLRAICDKGRQDPAGPKLGVLQLIVMDSEQVWTMDFSGDPKITRGRTNSADHTVVMTWKAIQDAVRQPGSISEAWASGQVQIPGVGARDVAVALGVLEKMSYLMSLARS